MKKDTVKQNQQNHPSGRLAIVGAASIAFGLAVSGPASAQDADATKILKSMVDYVSGQQNISFDYDSSIETAMPNNQRIQMDSSGKFQLSRPGKVRISRTGGASDVEFVSDGKQLTAIGKKMNAYTQVDLKDGGGLDVIAEHLQSDLPISSKELVHANGFNALTAALVDAKVIGQGVINGVKCDQIALRTARNDWQLWVQSGAQAIPCKYVITSRVREGAPEYSITFKNWKTDPIDAGAFAFAAPAGARKVTMKAMPALDEHPVFGVVTTGQAK